MLPTSKERGGWISTDAISEEFYLDPDTDKLRLKRFGAVGTTPDGATRILFGDSLTEGPGSPVELGAAVSPSVLSKAITEVSEEVADVDERTAAAIVTLIEADGALQTEIDAAETDILAVQGEVDALKVMRECGVATLNDTTPVTVASAYDLRDPTVTFVEVIPYGVGTGTPGVPRIMSVSNLSFDVASLGGVADDSQVFWAVFA